MKWAISSTEIRAHPIEPGVSVRASSRYREVLRIGVLTGLLELLFMGLFCLEVFSAPPPLPQSPAIPGRQSVAESPRQRAARQFLARRGLPASHPRNPPSLLVPRLSIPDPRPQTLVPGAWTALGPTVVDSLTTGSNPVPVTGRISALAFDPSDPAGNHLYLGTTGAGLWKSQNAAAANPASVQFSPITDNLSALSGVLDSGVSVGALTIQPGGTGTILVGLGDPNDALDSYYGAGILRSADNGQTWSLIQQTSDRESGFSIQDYSFIGEGFAGFAWSTANTQLVVAAVSQANESTLVNAGQTASSYEGLYWSLDAGATWHLARITDPGGADVQGPQDGFALPDGNAATSVVWNPMRQLFFAAVRYHGYYQSPDGQNWTRSSAQPGAGLTTANCPTQSGSLGVAGCPIFRGSLTVNPQTGDTFAWTVDVYNQDQGIWQDTCAISGSACTNQAVTFAKQLSTTALETNTSSGPATIQNGDYNLTLAALPAAPGQGQDTLLFAGDNDLWKCSLADSCRWRNTTNVTTCAAAQVGEYQHAVASAPGDAPLLYIGTDSGLWRSPDQVAETGPVCNPSDATHWQNMNTTFAGSITEIDSLAQAASTPATLLTGLGALGAAGIVNAPASPGPWNQLLSGEGGPVAIDQTTPINTWYANNAAGVAIFRCASTTLCSPAAFGTIPAVGESQVEQDGLTMPYPATFLIDPSDHTQLLIGTCRLWRGPANGINWSAGNAISPILDGTGNTGSQFCSGNALIRSLAALSLPGGGEILYVGMAGLNDGGGSIVPGHLFSATLAANGIVSAWTDLTYAPVVNNSLAFNAFGYDLSVLYVDPHDTTGSTVYAAISAFANAAEPLQQLYRSTDAGQHWTAIRSNLPNAPVNAVAVDPQDPNTVYAATDVGVFLTRAVATCEASGAGACWSAYGSGLPLAPVTTLIATPPTATSLTLTAGTYGRGLWQIPTVTAGAALTTATLSPSSLTFAARTVGTTAPQQTITVKTTGTAATTVSAIAISGAAAADYAETDTCTGVAVAKNATCLIHVTFTPTQTGTRAASLVLSANVAGGELLVPLTGAGLSTGSISFAPTSLNFGQQVVGKPSAIQTVNVQNTGGSSVTINSIAVSVPFIRTTTTCTASLAPATACAVNIEFSPTQPGAVSGTVTLVDSAGTQSAPLAGIGVLGPTDTLSTTSVALAATVLGQTSPPQTLTLTNSGGLPLTGIGVSVASAFGPNDFTALSNCGSQLAAGASCGISVQFTPSLAAAESATLTLSDALRSQTVRLAGTGLNPPLISLSPASLNFSAQQIDTPSAPRAITLTNKGGAPLAQPSLSISGPGAASFSVTSTTCTASLAANAYCSIVVVFNPLATGVTAATLTAATTSSGVASASAMLSGTGLTPPVLALSPATLNFGTVVLGYSSNSFNVQVSNAGQVVMAQPTFAVTGVNAALLPDFAVSNPTDVAACTGTLNPGAQCYVQITFSPSALGVEAASLVVTAANAIPTTATVSLNGVGAPPIVLEASPGSIDFPATPVGLTTPAQKATFSNIGKKTANSLTFAVTGPYAIDPVTTTCKTSLAADASCTVGIAFTPTANGDQPGSLTASVSNQGVAPITVSLDGAGTAVAGIQVNPTQLTFGSIVLQALATPQTVTVTNNGQATLNGLSLNISGDFGLIGNQCPQTLAPGVNCTTGINFRPSATGIRTGTLTVSSTSAGVVASVVSLTGNGIPSGSMTVTPAVLSFGTLLVGQTSQAQTVTVSNVGATNLAGLQLLLAGDYGLPSNTCLTQLNAGAICSFTVNFSPGQPGTRIGSVTILSSTAGFTPVVVGLTGYGLPTAQLVVSPLQLAFSPVSVGASGAALSLQVSNPGTGTLTGLAFATASPFSVGSGTCATSLAPAANCSVPVTFSPRSAGLQSGIVTVSSTSLGVASVSVALSGSGLAAPAFTWSPTTLTFAPTTIAASAPGQTLTLSNFGGTPIPGLTLAFSGTAASDFTLTSNSCAATLPANSACSATVGFTPTVSGGRQAFLTASSSAGAVPASSVALSGTGLTPAVLKLTPAQLTFPATLTGQSSPAQSAIVTNSGQSPIGDLQLSLSPGFALGPSTNCTAALAGGASCTAAILFTPTVAGPVTGSLTALSHLAASAITALAGTGALPPGIAASPAALVQFPTTGVNHAAAPVTVTITNSGTLSALTGLKLGINTAGAGNGFALTASTCATTLQPLASCTVNVTFQPTHAPPTPGALSGALTITAANGVAPYQLALAGFAFDFTLFVTGNPSQTVVQGQTAYYTLAITPLGATSGAITFSCGTLPANAFCLFNPAQLKAIPANLTTTITVAVSSGKPSAASQDPAKPPTSHALSSGVSVLAFSILTLPFLSLPFLAARRKILIRCLPPATLALILAGITSCAGANGSSGLSHPGGGTPPGSYPITVTATSAGVLHTAQFTLVVN